jgi:hypothetical protein
MAMVSLCTGLISKESIAEAGVELRGSRVYIGEVQPYEHDYSVLVKRPPAGAEVDPEETHHRRPALGCKRPAEPQTGMGEWDDTAGRGWDWEAAKSLTYQVDSVKKLH